MDDLYAVNAAETNFARVSILAMQRGFWQLQTLSSLASLMASPANLVRADCKRSKFV